MRVSFGSGLVYLLPKEYTLTAANGLKQHSHGSISIDSGHIASTVTADDGKTELHFDNGDVLALNRGTIKTGLFDAAKRLPPSITLDPEGYKVSDFDHKGKNYLAVA